MHHLRNREILISMQGARSFSGIYSCMQHINTELLKRYHTGKCSPEEKKIVEEWLKKEDNLFESNELITTKDLLLQREIWQRIQLRMHNNQPRIRKLAASLVAAACIAAMVICAGWYLSANHINKNQATELAYKSYSVPKGTRSRLVLPDSSVIYIMGGSAIKYPENFAETSRDLVLEYGEIFLDVSQHPEQPFTVHSAGAQVKVLGTRFNIRNVGDDPFINVALTQGSIRFTSDNNISYILKPGEQLRFDKQLGLINKIEKLADIAATEGWTKGLLLFTNAPLKEVFKRLEQYYGVPFITTGKINLSVTLTANIDNIPLPKVLEMMEFSTNLRFRMSKGQVIVGNGPVNNSK